MRTWFSILLVLSLCSCGRADSASTVSSQAIATPIAPTQVAVPTEEDRLVGSDDLDSTTSLPQPHATLAPGSCATGCEVPTEGCFIKGIVSASGVRVFVVPSQEHYPTIKVDSAHGDRWFCTTDDATAAGWIALKLARTVDQP